VYRHGIALLLRIDDQATKKVVGSVTEEILHDHQQATSCMHDLDTI